MYTRNQHAFRLFLLSHALAYIHDNLDWIYVLDSVWRATFKIVVQENSAGASNRHLQQYMQPHWTFYIAFRVENQASSLACTFTSIQVMGMVCPL